MFPSPTSCVAGKFVHLTQKESNIQKTVSSKENCTFYLKIQTKLLITLASIQNSIFS